MTRRQGLVRSTGSGRPARGQDPLTTPPSGSLACLQPTQSVPHGRGEAVHPSDEVAIGRIHAQDLVPPGVDTSWVDGIYGVGVI